MTGPAWNVLRMSSVLVAAALGLQGCYIYSAFQGARTLDKGRVSVSPAVSLVNYSEDGESEWMTGQFGLRGAVGLGNRLELRTHYERVSPKDIEVGGLDGDVELEGYNYLDLGLKYGVIPGILAVGLPIGFMFGGDVDETESWQLQPSLYLTAPVARFLDVNVSTTGLYFLNDDDDNFLWAFNGGFGIRPVDNRFTLLPEMGLLFNPGEAGMFWHWGVGASVEF